MGFWSHQDYEKLAIFGTVREPQVELSLVVELACWVELLIVKFPYHGVVEAAFEVQLSRSQIESRTE